MLTNKKSMKYYNKRAVCNVLSGLFNNARLFNDTRYSLNEDDFIDKLHRTLYVCLYNLVNQGLEQVEIADVEAYLSKNNMVAYKLLFDEPDNLEWLGLIKENTSDINFEYYYMQVKKMSLLRGYIEAGIDVSGLLDKSEIDVTIVKMQEEKLDKMSLQDIMDYFDVKSSEVKSKFTFSDNEYSSVAGKGDLELYKKLKEKPAYGLSTECGMLNTITRGFRPKNYWVCSMGTGQGKSRNSIKRCIVTSCREYYNIGLKKWVKNPIPDDHPSLYIGTELSIEEIKCIMWAIVSGVSQDRIMENKTTDEEEERILKAISILEESPIYIESNDDYSILWLKNTIEKYKREQNIELVTLDYIETTTALESEYAQKTRGIKPREDLVLLGLSKSLKSIANAQNICIIAYTQVNDNAYVDMARNNRAISGCKALPNKADIAYTVFQPTDKEKKLIEPYENKLKGYKSKLHANAVYTIYKNRGGKYNAIKLWTYVNLGNMEVVELFTTDMNYNLINIESTTIEIEA